MWWYVVRRLFAAIPTILVIIVVAFLLIHSAPGGPFDQERVLSPEIEANLLRAYNLDRSVWYQLCAYIKGLTQGDFGPSFTYRELTVGSLIKRGLPVSARLGLCALGLALVVGTTVGVLAALRQNTRADYLAMGFAVAGITIPTFVTAPLLTLVFGVYLGWLPVAGWNGGDLRHLLLPVIALALPQIAIVSRLVRAGMIEVLHSNYLRTARAKGLPSWLIITRHAAPAAVTPVLSYLGPATASLVTGSAVIETIFGLPGIGRYFVQGAINRDYTLVMGTVITYGILLVLLNIIVDLLYGVLDPRVRSQ